MLYCAYFGVFKLNENPVSNAFWNIGNYLELSFCHLEALLFVVMGKIFAEYGTLKAKGNIYFIFITFFLMAGELFLTMYLDIFVYPEAFFLLPIFIFIFMNLMLSIDSQNEKFIKISRKLKKVGSFSYLFHIQYFYYLHWILDSTGHNIFREYIGLLIIPYLICILICFGLQTLFEYLSKYKFLSFLKYSY